MAEMEQAAPKTDAAGARKATGATKAAKVGSPGSQDGRATSTAGTGRRTTAGASRTSSTARSRSAAAGDGSGAAPRAAARPRGTRQPDLKKDLRDFASARPQGWNHDDWLTFLEDLQRRGHNISDREAIGLALEKERLHLALSGLKGIGPQKRQSLVEYYGNLWQLRHADPDEIARVGNLQRTDAERIKSEI